MKCALLVSLSCAALACESRPRTDAGASQHAGPTPSRPASTAAEIQLPGGEGGIGFDDVRYSRALGRVLVPAGRTGNLDLVDPESGAVTALAGFSKGGAYSGGHGVGTTSVDEGGAFLYAVDRSSKSIAVVDPDAKKIVSTTALRASPDYPRFVAPTREVWVTEPDADQIEVLRARAGERGALESIETIAVEGGPECLVVDEKRGRAYTHLWDGATVAIDLRSRAIVARWKNGCGGSRGIALDEERGFLLVGCAEGRATVLDVAHDGRVLSSAKVGEGVDIIDYDAKRRHVYVPSEKEGTLAILGVSTKGELSTLGTLPAAKGVHSAATDGAGRVFVPDPATGRLLVLVDDFAASAD